jgi:hypothetical protein
VLFEKFFRKISAFLPPDFMAGNLDALADLNPSRIYVENVRVAFRVSHSAAVRFCESAVRQGLFQRFIEIECPNGSVAVSIRTDEKMPEHVRCFVDVDGFKEEVELPTVDLTKHVFYRLTDAADDPAEAHTVTA